MNRRPIRMIEYRYKAPDCMAHTKILAIFFILCHALFIAYLCIITTENLWEKEWGGRLKCIIYTPAGYSLAMFTLRNRFDQEVSRPAWFQITLQCVERSLFIACVISIINVSHLHFSINSTKCPISSDPFYIGS